MRTFRRLFWFALAVALVSGGTVAAQARARASRGGGPMTKYAYFEIAGLLQDSLPPVYLFETEGETLHSMISRMDRARLDDRVKGLMIRVRGFAANWAKVQEVRQAMLRCRQDGKDVICVLDGAGNIGYYLASAAGRIVLAPTGHLMLVGLRAEVIFAKGLLDKVGVKAESVQAGKYKTAGETLTREEPSPAFRESLESMLQDYYEQLVEGIVEGRGVSAERAAALIKEGPFTARQAKEAGLADDVMFYDELVAELREERFSVETDYGRTRRPRAVQPGSMNVFSMLMGGGRPARRRTTGPTVAVLHAAGPIVSGDIRGLDFGEQIVYSRAFIKTLRKAVDDDNIKAIVLRVDSPGGSARACDTIWRALRLADAKKPVIASLSDVAASGGYYIAAGSRKIYAEPGCLTGSIGVFGGKLVLTGLFDKLGLKVTVIERGGATGLTSMFSELSPQERQKLQELILDTYDTFLERVAETRPNMSVEDVDKVAQGRVWTARQAEQRGLIDALGGLKEAIEEAKRAAGIAPEQRVEILHLPRPRSLMEVVLFGREGAVQMSLPAGLADLPLPLERVRPYLRALLSLQDEVSVCILPAIVTVR